MLFNSPIFIFIFLPLTFFIYFYLNKQRLVEASKGFLVLASLFFYSWWNITYLPIILGSILFNYVIGVSLSKETKNIRVNRKLLLTIGIMANVALLGYFKYVDFLIENVNWLLSEDLSLLNLSLPLAISFFTFQQIAYLVDSYRGETKEYDFLNYTNFVTFFPQLIAGPIVHHSEMMPQFAKIKNKVKNYNNIALGIFIFSIGLFKKVVISDSFSVWATAGFDVMPKLNFIEAWSTSLAYTFQLYFDFSGYTDMAIGAALLFNIKLPINFNSPYKALDIQDFWRRWHITLSRFLKEYIYIPLGGNRKSNIRTYTNLLMTFVIGGIWHGAGWTFVFWGFLHGLALVVQKIWQKIGFKLNRWIAWLITFNFINIAWVFFRAKDWNDAIKVLIGMTQIKDTVKDIHFSKHFDFVHPVSEYFHQKMFTVEHSMLIKLDIYESIIIGFFIILGFKNSNELGIKFSKFKKVPILWYLYTIIIFGIALIVTTAQTSSEFLYFNF